MSATYTLPGSLQRALYDGLGAVYGVRGEVFYLVEVSADEIRAYNGTYFPRSWAESRVIFGEVLRIPGVRDQLAARGRLRVLDVGSGSGGQLFGLLDALRDAGLGHVTVDVDAIDGNVYALEFLRILWKILRCRGMLVRGCSVLDHHSRVGFRESLGGAVGEFGRDGYDLILSFKFLIEIYGAMGAEAAGLYGDLATTLVPHLRPDGLMLLLDITAQPTSPDRTWKGDYTSILLPREVRDATREPGSDLAVVLPHPCRVWGATCPERGCYQTFSTSVRHDHLPRPEKPDQAKSVWHLLAHAAHASTLAEHLPQLGCWAIGKKTLCQLSSSSDFPVTSAFEV